MDNPKSIVDMLKTTLYVGRMKSAYGYNRDPKDFAHTGVDTARIYIDHNGTRNALDNLVNRGGAREGDTIVVLALGDLGNGVAAKKSQRLIENMGITIEVVPVPEAVKAALPRGRPAFDPSPDLDATLRDMWGNPIKYTQSYVIRYATEKHGKAVTRNQLNHRYGNRYPKERDDG